MTLDVDQLRADTPSCLDQTFLDNAGAALRPTGVNEAVFAYLEREQQIGGYAAAEEVTHTFDQIRADIGSLVGCPSEHVALSTSATAAYMRALSAIRFHAGDRILISSAEYGSNVLPLLQIRDQIGVSVEIIPDGEDGVASPSALANLLDERVKLVSLTHAPSQNGLVLDAAAVGEVLRDSPAWFLLDTCQSVGQLPVDLTGFGADFVTGTGRKWVRGPRGTGFLGVSQRVLDELEPVPIDMFGANWVGSHYELNPDASRFQSFEIPYGSMIGTGVAIQYALRLGPDQVFARIRELAESLRERLQELPHVTCLDRGTIKSGIVTFDVPGNDPFERVLEFREQGISLSAVTAKTNPHDYAHTGGNCVLRASPHVYNNEADLDRLVVTLGSLRP